MQRSHSDTIMRLHVFVLIRNFEYIANISMHEPRSLQISVNLPFTKSRQMSFPT